MSFSFFLAIFVVCVACISFIAFDVFDQPVSKDCYLVLSNVKYISSYCLDSLIDLLQGCMPQINVMILLDARIIDDNKTSGLCLQNLNLCMNLVFSCHRILTLNHSYHKQEVHAYVCLTTSMPVSEHVYGFGPK